MSSACINNDFYHYLGEKWWSATDHMVTFLRDESIIKLDYIQKNIALSVKPLRILDLGTGAGLITIPLAQQGHHVTAVDLSEASLAVLKQYASKANCLSHIHLLKGDILTELPIENDYDLVLAMDVLEHVENPNRVLKNLVRHLKPQGWLIYHTLNRTFLCWLLYLKIAPMLIRHSPENIHLWRYNVKPQQMQRWLADLHFGNHDQIGIHAPIWQKATLELLTQRALKSKLRFEYCQSLSLGYLGRAQKLPAETF